MRKNITIEKMLRFVLTFNLKLTFRDKDVQNQIIVVGSNISQFTDLKICKIVLIRGQTYLSVTFPFNDAVFMMIRSFQNCLGAPTQLFIIIIHTDMNLFEVCQPRNVAKVKFLFCFIYHTPCDVNSCVYLTFCYILYVGILLYRL